MDLIAQYPAIVNGIGVFIAAFLTPILGKWGIDSSGAQTIVAALLSFLSTIVGVALIALTHKKVTPVANPKLNDGTPLVPDLPAVPLGS
jgi:hypothetical protein